MRSAWTILLITAVTDAVIGFGTGVTAVMAESGKYPGGPAVLTLAVGALVIFARTIQQALKAKPADSAELRGANVVTVTKLPGASVITAPPDQMADQAARSAANVLPEKKP